MIQWLNAKSLDSLVWVLTTFFVAALGCSAAKGPEMDADPVPRASSEIPDPDASARIDAMTADATESFLRAANFLADQTHVQFKADISFDIRQRDGRLLEFGSRRTLSMERPDRIRMQVDRRDGESSTLYFDGSVLSIDLPAHNAFVREEVPGTLYAAIDYLTQHLDTPVPLANLLSENFAKPLEGKIQAGYYVGQARIDGRDCEHLAISLPDVDAQLWIEEGERPVLARLVITHKLEAGNPQFRANLYDWNFTPEDPVTLFGFEPAEDSERIAVDSIAADSISAPEGDE